MAELRLKTEADLLSINGVGEAKLERYGCAFLEVIFAA
jgi:superfamily II DNA helicase RecQ